MRSIVVLVAVAAVAASPAGAVRSVPVLKLTHGQPLTISGARFADNERVTVTVHARQPYLRRVVTNADGSFSVSFGVVASARCAGLTAVAIGSSGDRATLRVPRPACTA